MNTPAWIDAQIDARTALCEAMAKYLQGLEHWSELPDDTAVLQSISIDGTGEYRITAGMIREANR